MPPYPSPFKSSKPLWKEADVTATSEDAAPCRSESTSTGVQAEQSHVVSYPGDEALKGVENANQDPSYVHDDIMNSEQPAASEYLAESLIFGELAVENVEREVVVQAMPQDERIPESEEFVLSDIKASSGGAPVAVSASTSAIVDAEVSLSNENSISLNEQSLGLAGALAHEENDSFVCKVIADQVGSFVLPIC